MHKFRWTIVPIAVLLLASACGSPDASGPQPDGDETAVTDSDPAEVVAAIDGILTQIVETYESGDAEAAAEFAAEAYLENYEVIEDAVSEEAPEVNEELEHLLGAELRQALQSGASEEDIAAMVETIRGLLADALAALESAS